MNVVMEYAESDGLLDSREWDIAFHGRLIDYRSAESKAYMLAHSRCAYEFYYDAENLEWSLDGQNCGSVDDIEKIFLEKQLDAKHILIDSTTLNFAEILILFQTYKLFGTTQIDALYLEPAKYKVPSERLIESRHFQLSAKIKGFLAIPKHALSFESNDLAVVLCGYEGERLGHAFEEYDINGEFCRLIFGMPPYSYGWDMNSYVNFLPIISNNNIAQTFDYCPAANPLAVYEKLCTIYESIDQYQKMFILPFGTKPMSLGAVLFIINNPNHNISVLYDHPVVSEDCTTDVIKWNLYKITL